ncbi:unnamed protein product, partial [Polarella glacialis]
DAAALLFGEVSATPAAADSQTSRRSDDAADFLFGDAFSSPVPAVSRTGDDSAALLFGDASSGPAPAVSRTGDDTAALLFGDANSRPAPAVSRTGGDPADFLFGDAFSSPAPAVSRTGDDTAALLFGDESSRPAPAASRTGASSLPAVHRSTLSLIDLGDSDELSGDTSNNWSPVHLDLSAPSGGRESASAQPATSSTYVDLSVPAGAGAAPQQSGSSASEAPSSRQAGAWGHGATGTSASSSSAQSRGAAKAKAKAKAKAGPGSGSVPAPSQGPSRGIPANARGFGSDDLFGPAAGPERSMQEEAEKALGAVYRLLPDQVKLAVPDCMAATHADDREELLVDRQVGEVEGVEEESRNALEEEHEATAVNRAVEGRWVPTYMRHQLAAGGHTTLPSAPNAHEYSAGEAPPSLGATFLEMGVDLGEGAQAVLDFLGTFLATFSVQCQVCSHQTVSSAHDQVITFGENLCGAVPEEGELVVLGPLVSEAAAGLGPIRSRVKRSMPGVSFENLLQVVKMKLVTPSAAPEFARSAVRSRALAREVVDNTCGIEDWLFNTEVQPSMVPADYRTHICVSNGPMGLHPLKCHEIWHVERRGARAEVEITSAPSGSLVIVVLRLEIVGLPNDGCEVDSRLFLRPREFGAMLPRGLVEELTEVHHLSSENLRDVVLAFGTEDAPNSANAEPEPEAGLGGQDYQGYAGGIAQDGHGPPPVVQWPFKERVPSWAMDATPEKRSTSFAGVPLPQAGVSLAPLDEGSALNKDFLLQVARGI